MYKDGKCGSYTFYANFPPEYTQPEFDKISVLGNGVYAVSLDSKWGIQVKDSVVVPIKFEDVRKLNQGFYGMYTIFYVKYNGKWGVYDVSYKSLIVPTEYDEITFEGIGIFKVRKGTKWETYQVKSSQSENPQSEMMDSFLKMMGI